MASTLPSTITRFTGNMVSTAGGTAVGTATAAALLPFLQEIINASESLHPVKPAPAGTMAAGVAQGQVTDADAREFARQQGIGDKAFNALVAVANTGPGVPIGFELWRRHKTDEAGFRRAAKRVGLEQEWIDGLAQLFYDVLDQQQLANAIHRGLIPAPTGLLLGHTPGPGLVDAYPVYPIDALAEAEANGYDHDHLGVLVGLTGLPMGSHEAAQATFRGVIVKEDFYRAIAEGNTRNEWADAIFDQSRQIPTAHDYVELRLRGYTDDAGMNAGSARHGMTPDDTHVLFQAAGRPLSFHQVFIGERRGGTLDGPTTGIDAAFLDSLKKSNIRPEYYNLAWAQRYTYPSAFVLRSLTQTGDLTQAETETILLYEGWEPTLAHTVSVKWAGGTGATPTADPWVKKAEGQLWTTTHKSYVAGDTTQADAAAALTALGVTAAAQPAVFALWDHERALVRKELSATQVRKAFTGQVVNPATGVAWTLDEAIAELVTRGYSDADARTFMAEA